MSPISANSRATSALALDAASASSDGACSGSAFREAMPTLGLEHARERVRFSAGKTSNAATRSPRVWAVRRRGGRRVLRDAGQSQDEPGGPETGVPGYA